jgi:hypothetical protein
MKKGFNKAPVEKKVEPPIPSDLKKEVIEATEEVTKEEVIEEAEAIIDGVDTALNIRKEPEMRANNQIAILSKGTKIIIVDPKKPVNNKDGEWYKVRIKKDSKAPEDNGYALKKYIKII